MDTMGHNVNVPHHIIGYNDYNIVSHCYNIVVHYHNVV